MSSAAEEYLVKNYGKTSFVLTDFLNIQNCNDQKVVNYTNRKYSPSRSPSNDNGTSYDNYVQRTSILSKPSDELIVQKNKLHKDYLVSNNFFLRPVYLYTRNDLIRKSQDKQVELQVDEEISVDDIILLNILFSLKSTYSQGYSADLLNESTIAKDSLVPLLDSYFPSIKKTTSFGADKDFPESRKRFKKMDPSLYEHVRRADFSIVSNSSRQNQ
ncbi:hypothetical protein EDC94DRAFT_590764 [Helicostylum pulchrum]|nr:hypothetical protein EDC94DRAFT_590764 [Helicostylum pulchrum]